MTRFLHCLAVALALVALPAASARPPEAAAEPAFRTIVLVRHGHYAPDPSADPRLGPHLSALGVAQARLAGARLAGLPVRFDKLYASPLQRARDTAASIAADLPGRPFQLEDDLAECTPPSREKRVAASEKPADLAACQRQLERLYAAHFRPAEGASSTELYVCHGNVIRYLTTRALGVDPTAWLSMSIGHASITRIRIAPDGSMQVIAVGDVGHLPPNLQTGASGDPERNLENAALLPAG
jgi:serine/threonine-protein phosphatase PGAM5